jgi:CHAD domain-containing protein
MKKVYRRARKGWKRARSQHDPVILHDWRKRAKYLRYHFQLLKGVDNKWADNWHRGFKQLSNLLGEHHDLEVLRQYLDSLDAGVMSPAAECEFRMLLHERQDALYHQALQLGETLLHKKPKKIARRVNGRLQQIDS